MDSKARSDAALRAVAPNWQNLSERYLELLLEGRRHDAGEMILDAVERGASVKDVYLRVFQPVQYRIGELWQKNEVSVAQEHFCTATTQLVMSRLYPYIFNSERKGKTAVACCVGGELHELGIRMVADFMEMHGWDTYYLGASTPNKDVAVAVAERNAQVLAVSVTMSYNLHLADTLIDEVRQSLPPNRVKILVGGIPFTGRPERAYSMGADSTAADAESALLEAERLVEELAS